MNKTLVKLMPLFAFVVLTLFVVTGCQEPATTDKLEFNRANALKHIRPYDTIRSYIQSFGELRSKTQNGSVIIDTTSLPLAESFNVDAIKALLNAKGATNIRVYFGRKPNGEIAMCLLPVDAKGNDLVGELVSSERVSAISIPGISSAQAQPTSKAQGVEEGQRCPTMCSTKPTSF